MGREIRWSCPHHGNGKAEIIAQVQTSNGPTTSVEWGFLAPLKETKDCILATWQWRFPQHETNRI